MKYTLKFSDGRKFESDDLNEMKDKADQEHLVCRLKKEFLGYKITNNLDGSQIETKIYSLPKGWVMAPERDK